MPKVTTFAKFEFGKSITLIMEGIYNTTHLSGAFGVLDFPCTMVDPCHFNRNGIH
jgi:hypothetical protein